MGSMVHYQWFLSFCSSFIMLSLLFFLVNNKFTSYFSSRWVCEDVPELKMAMENRVLNQYDTKR